MTKLVTIFGGSGFAGRYIARRMAKQGWRVRVAVRRPNEAMHVKPYGAVGQVEPVFANIRDDASVAAALSGADAVVNCVGTFDRTGRNNFQAVQADGAARVARLAAKTGISALVHISAMGADENGLSDYAQTKAQGEAEILAAMPNAVILRPSVMFGTEDGFFNRFAEMTKLGPVLPLVGGTTRFQPVYVDDVAAAVENALLGRAAPGVYELGGPEVKTLHQWIDDMLGVIQRRRLVLNLPFWVGKIIAGIFDGLQAVTLGLFHNSILTRDQVKSLRNDNVAPQASKGLADLGVTATPVETIIDEYLWPYRPSGQYAAIKNSAKNLKA